MAQTIITIKSQGPKGDKGNPGLIDGRGTTVHLSGSEYSGSILTALTVTGSIIPEGSGSWDLGSPSNPFKDLYVTTESIKFVNRSTGRVESSLSSKNVSDLKAGKTIATGSVKGVFSPTDTTTYMKLGSGAMGLFAGGEEQILINKDICNIGQDCTDTLTIKSRTVINCAVTCSGLLSTAAIYAPAFIETGTGTPTITSDSNLVLSASNAVVIASSPLRLRSFTNTNTGSGEFTFIAGDMYFNSTTNKFMGYNGTTHVALSS